MSDPIRFVQRVIGRLTGKRELFAFTPAYWGAEGIEVVPLREQQSRLGRIFGTRWFSRAYPGVVGRVHIHDTMLLSDSPEEIAHYIKVGQSAMENIEATLAAGGRSLEDVGACLDMACGYGRVLRLLQTRIAPGRITACELEEEAVRFLAAEFGVRPLISQKDLSRLEFPETYDLIWVGSLFTHLSQPDGFALLEKLVGQLNPRGLLVFSTQGASCLEHFAQYGWMFVPREAYYRHQLATAGWAYSDYYEKDPGYGITMYREDALAGMMAEQFGDRLRQVYIRHRGWDDHQDIWGYQRL